MKTDTVRCTFAIGAVAAVMVALFALSYFAQVSLSTPTYPAPAVKVEEDSPQWRCWVDGNGACSAPDGAAPLHALLQWTDIGGGA